MVIPKATGKQKSPMHSGLQLDTQLYMPTRVVLSSVVIKGIVRFV